MLMRKRAELEGQRVNDLLFPNVYLMRLGLSLSADHLYFSFEPL